MGQSIGEWALACQEANLAHHVEGKRIAVWSLSMISSQARFQILLLFLDDISILRLKDDFPIGSGSIHKAYSRYFRSAAMLTSM
jgi:hypothetical protein